MHILLTNDDGVYAPGIWALAEALKDIAELTVVAPDRHLSGAGFSITTYEPVKVTEVPSRMEGVRTFAVEGTPADAVLIGHQVLAKDHVDLVMAGINDGANLGNNIMMSGTVGAAFQAQILGSPAVSLSVTSPKQPPFGPSARVGRELAKLFLDRGVREPVLLNVNVPAISMEEITGANMTRLASYTYKDDVVRKAKSDKFDTYWLVRNSLDWDYAEGTDAWAIHNNHISLTLLNFGATSHPAARLLDGVAPELFRAVSKGE